MQNCHLDGTKNKTHAHERLVIREAKFVCEQNTITQDDQKLGH